MTRADALSFLINELMPDAAVPTSEEERWTLFRSLVNVRPAGPVSESFLRVQDELLQNEAKRKGIVQWYNTPRREKHLHLWQGDITRLAVDAIVNAANSGMTGCYYPCHNCIDNVIHTYAGVQLRNECARIMKAQGHPEPTAQAKITPGYNLPATHIIHTVGPIVHGALSSKNRNDLRTAYESILACADENGLESIAFCCLSTGEYHFPNDIAAEIAIATVRHYHANGGHVAVLFNVFKNIDYELYDDILKK